MDLANILDLDKARQYAPILGERDSIVTWLMSELTTKVEFDGEIMNVTMIDDPTLLPKVEAFVDEVLKDE